MNRQAASVLRPAAPGALLPVFAGVGIPAAMVLVRNTNGSHNPHEAMAIEDFMAGTRTMAAAIAAVAG